MTTTSRWRLPAEDPPPPEAPAADVEPHLWELFDAALFVLLSESQQREVFKGECQRNGWHWPGAARAVQRRLRGGAPNRLTPSQRSLQARMAAYSSWARTGDPSARTASARQALLNRFVQQVDPESRLPAEERMRRAEQAKREYFARMALKSSRKRAGG